MRDLPADSGAQYRVPLLEPRSIIGTYMRQRKIIYCGLTRFPLARLCDTKDGQGLKRSHHRTTSGALGGEQKWCHSVEQVGSEGVRGDLQLYGWRNSGNWIGNICSIDGLLIVGGIEVHNDDLDSGVAQTGNLRRIGLRVGNDGGEIGDRSDMDKGLLAELGVINQPDTQFAGLDQHALHLGLGLTSTGVAVVAVDRGHAQDGLVDANLGDGMLRPQT